MSSTNVRVKASSARSEAKPSMAKSISSAPASGHRNDEATAKASVAVEKAKRAESASHAPGGSAKSEPSAFDDVAEKARPYLDKHGHAIVYGIVGIAAAVLILTIGFWPVLLLAVFAAIGIAIGKFRDSGASMQNAARSLAENIRR